VQIDDDPPKYIDRFDKYCFYTRLSFFFIEGLEAGKHKIRVEVSQNRFDKFRIIGKKPEEVEAPCRYNEYSWMVGRILVNGELLNR
jgi:hypothetical protein